ncbi:Flp family type IVb pilin [Marinicauda algicola]|uniref:Flp family type IVb pilin n=1 Tax=Marinicauda algicola TaxID=2029849 RepID=UPI003BAF127D
MGAHRRAEGLPHAAGRHSAGSGAARPAHRSARARLNAFLADERAATSIEYALIASIVSIAIVTAVTSIGGTLTGWAWDVVAGFNQ